MRLRRCPWRAQKTLPKFLAKILARGVREEQGADDLEAIFRLTPVEGVASPDGSVEFSMDKSRMMEASRLHS